ncbi:uncharacterized protein PpBr36_09237 [Pyricularia pennisetigena]|uniref:uncharacterized protein n=1 Tax=Pyricularia pennisetigena TaxID=1578925 RepID=UPI001150176B|nr:uncharacterized protein PpBr36_09237 [Pyricularia pennisetigena]TLS22099.1 hypothetical protein PpBr36_09237 [Pyricularia pennisetigena]
MQGPAKKLPSGDAQPKKRQAGPQDDNTGPGRPNKRAKARADRNIPVHASASDAVTEDGEVNLPIFLEALQSSIGGLEKAMRKSKASGTKRAFQQVPRDMRRRTASHNPKRVPGRLRARARVEMASDNTPAKGKKRAKDKVERALNKVEKARLALRKTLKQTEAIREGLHLRASTVQVPETKTNSKNSGESRCLKAQFEHLSNALDKTRKLVGRLQVQLDLGDVRSVTDQTSLATQQVKNLEDAMTKTKKLNNLLSELRDPNQKSDLSDKLGKALVKTKKLNKNLAKVKQPTGSYNSDTAENEEEDDDIEMGSDTDCPQTCLLPPRRKNIPRRDDQLPTHLWHAKRAKMSTIDNPFFSKPTPINMNTKTVRKIHRAYNASAFMHDASHKGFIQVSGAMNDVREVLEVVGIDYPGATADWIRGCRVWTGIIRLVESRKTGDITPARVIWNPSGQPLGMLDDAATPRQVLIEIEPDTAELVVRALTTATDHLGDKRNQVTIRDLSSKLGCIELLGPGSGQRLIDVLRPPQSPSSQDAYKSTHWRLFRAIAQAQPSMLGYSVAMGLMIRYPDKYGREDVSRTDCIDKDEAEQLLAAQEEWSTERNPQPLALLDRTVRGGALQLIQKRQGAALNGSKNDTREHDQSGSSIPIILLCSSSHTREIAGKWTLVCQRELVKPLWLRLFSQKGHFGGEIGIACVEEMHRIHTEQAVKFHPVDFPHTVQGTLWELRERDRLKKEWESLPKGKRPNWTTLNLGHNGKGELGNPFACDWEHLLHGANPLDVKLPHTPNEDKEAKDNSPARLVSPDIPRPLAISVSSALFRDFFWVGTEPAKRPSIPVLGISTVHISMLEGGVPNPRARVYLLPNSREQEELRSAWMERFKVRIGSVGSKRTQKLSSDRRFPQSSTFAERKEILAESLFHGKDCEAAAGIEGSPVKAYPQVFAKDLMGYVTSGGYNLARGRGHGIGHLAASKIVESMQATIDAGGIWNDAESFYCVVRNVGETICRPAIWRFVEESRGRR